MMDNEIDSQVRRLMATTGMSKAEATANIAAQTVSATESDAMSAELAKVKEARQTKEPKTKLK